MATSVPIVPGTIMEDFRSSSSSSPTSSSTPPGITPSAAFHALTDFDKLSVRTKHDAVGSLSFQQHLYVALFYFLFLFTLLYLFTRRRGGRSRGGLCPADVKHPTAYADIMAHYPAFVVMVAFSYIGTYQLAGEWSLRSVGAVSEEPATGHVWTRWFVTNLVSAHGANLYSALQV